MPRILPFIIAALAAALLAAPPARVAACSCMAMTEAEAFAGAEAVFVGTAIDLMDPAGGKPDDPFAPVLYRFAVEEVGKGLGALDRQVVVETFPDEAMCGAGFAVGERYAVYAQRVDGGALSSSACSGNRALGPGQLPVEEASTVDGGLPVGLLLAGLAVLGLGVLSALAFTVGARRASR